MRKTGQLCWSSHDCLYFRRHIYISSMRLLKIASSNRLVLYSCVAFHFATIISALNCSIESQNVALQAFYVSNGGAGWNASTGWSSNDQDTCNWLGIQCNDDGLVSTIYLPFNNVSQISLAPHCLSLSYPPSFRS